MMRELGLLDSWKRLYTTATDLRVRRCQSILRNKETMPEKQSFRKPLSLESLSGAFVLLLVGFGVAAIVFFIELLIVRLALKKKAQNKITPEKKVEKKIKSLKKEVGKIKANNKKGKEALSIIHTKWQKCFKPKQVLETKKKMTEQNAKPEETAVNRTVEQEKKRFIIYAIIISELKVEETRTLMTEQIKETTANITEETKKIITEQIKAEETTVKRMEPKGKIPSLIYNKETQDEIIVLEE